MPVRVKPATKGINSSLLLASLSGAAAWAAAPTAETAWQQDLMFGFLAGIAAVGTVKSVKAMVRDARLRRALAASEEVSDDHGSARQATWEEIVARGMHRPQSGNFLGLQGGRLPVFGPPKAPFSLFEASPGAGKSVSWVVPSILCRAKLGYSLMISDPKNELGPMLIPGLRARGFEVWAIHPTAEFSDIVGGDEVNLYEPLLDAVYAEDTARRRDAVKLTADYASLHYPDVPGEKQPYFSFGARRATGTGALIQAVYDPGRCTPGEVYSLLNNPRRFIEKLLFVRDHLDTGDPNDPLIRHLKDECANLVHRAEKTEENFGAFLEGATQRLLPFTRAGRLGGYGERPNRSITEIRDRQVIVFVMTPLSHLRELAPFISLLNHNVLAACKAKPNGHPVHIVAEEALSYRFQDIVSDMETLRGLRVSADFYIQSYAGLVKKYGKEAAEAIESYADVRVYAGINSHARAKFVSDLLSEATIRKQDYSYKADVDGLGISSRELGRRLMQPNEILSLPQGQAWAFVRGMNPMLLTMAHYGQVSPWRDWVGDNPVEGSRLYADPLFHIDYGDDDDA
jgi:type IV secretory pathway TraG/TraD family ATPase VirD4